MTITKISRTNYLPFILVGVGLLILVGIAVYSQVANGTDKDI